MGTSMTMHHSRTHKHSHKPTHKHRSALTSVLPQASFGQKEEIGE